MPECKTCYLASFSTCRWEQSFCRAGVFFKHHKATVSACFCCTGEADACRGRRAEASALYPSCSVSRGLKLISSRSRKNGEKGSETTDRKGFFSTPFLRLKRMSVSLTFHRGKQLFIKSVQRPTCLASDAIKGSQHFQIKYINRPL